MIKTHTTLNTLSVLKYYCDILRVDFWSGLMNSIFESMKMLDKEDEAKFTK